jgi:hypothetical protein
MYLQNYEAQKCENWRLTANENLLPLGRKTFSEVDRAKFET